MKNTRPIRAWKPACCALLEARDRVRDIRLLEQRDLLGRKLQGDGRQSVVEMLQFGGTALPDLQYPAEDLLAGTVGIHIRRVEEVDASLQSALHEGPVFLFAERPKVIASIRHAVAHAAKADAVQTRTAKVHVLRLRTL